MTLTSTNGPRERGSGWARLRQLPPAWPTGDDDRPYPPPFRAPRAWVDDDTHVVHVCGPDGTVDWRFPEA